MKQKSPISFRNLAGILYVGFFLAFLFVPLIVMILFSFNSSPRLSFPIHSLSLSWYRALIDDELFLDAFRRTLFLGLGTAIASGIIGLLAALGLVRLKLQVRTIAMGLAAVPLAFPALLYAIALAFFFNKTGVGFSLWTTLLGHVILTMPFVFLIVGSALERFQFSMLEAARDLGAGPFHAFRTITLPHILPAVVGAMLLAMAISADEFVVAFFTAGQAKTLPMLLYGRLNLGITPALNAVGVVLLVVTTLLAALAALSTRFQVER